MLLEKHTFNGQGIRIELVDGAPWFCLADVSEVLDMAPSTVRMFPRSKWCDTEGVKRIDTNSARGTRQSLFISERNLYALVMRSDKPDALKFFDWVTGTVLPEIRKTGSYGVAALPQDLPSALRALADSVEQQSKLQEEIKALEPKAEFHDKVAVAINCQTIQEVAKVLDMGPNKFFDWLRKHGYLMQKSTVAYQKHIDAGLFKLVERSWKDEHGEVHTYVRTLVTGKGIIHLAKKLNKPIPFPIEETDE